MKETKPIVYYDSNAEYTYEDYCELCALNNVEAAPEGSDEFYDWLTFQIEANLYDFLESLKYSKLGKEPVLITGKLGLWNGAPAIYPLLFTAQEHEFPLLRAVQRCMLSRDAYSAKVTLSNGVLHIFVSHHDGTNSFKIRRLSNAGAGVVRNLIEAGKSISPKKYWFRSFGREL